MVRVLTITVLSLASILLPNHRAIEQETFLWLFGRFIRAWTRSPGPGQRETDKLDQSQHVAHTVAQASRGEALTQQGPAIARSPRYSLTRRRWTDSAPDRVYR